MELKCEKKVLIVVDCSDLEAFINKHYDHKIEIVADQETGNDVSITIKLSKVEMREFEQKQLDEYKKSGKGMYMLNTLMRDLCNQGILDAGEYLINMSW